MSSDGVIMIGKIGAWSNVAVNVGPGSNGWKVALGSGEVLAEALDGRQGLHGGDFDRDSLSPVGRIVSAPIWARLC